MGTRALVGTAFRSANSRYRSTSDSEGSASMSSMAKIFVVVNLLLGVAAFGSAATLLGAQNDYRAALEAKQAEYVKLQNDLKTAQDDFNAQILEYPKSESPTAVRRMKNVAKDLAKTRATP